MPGIFGCAGLQLSHEQLIRIEQRMSAALQPMQAADRFSLASCVHASFLVGSHTARQVGQSTPIVRSDHVLLALNGTLLNPAWRSNPVALVELFLQHGSGFVDLLRGHLSAVVANSDSGDIWLFTDHAASRPVYYAFQDGVLYFAGDCVALAEVLPRTADVNPHAVVDMLTFGYMTGGKTPVQGVECLPAGGYLHWNVRQGQPEVDRYFVANNSPLESMSYQELRDELERLFVQAVQRNLWSSSGLFTLSGGLDSRAITTTARDLGVTKPDCLIFGEAESLDVKLAQRTAKSLGAQPYFVDLNNGEYLIDHFPTSARYNGGMVYYSGSAHMLHALQSIGAQRWEVVHTGMSGDMLMGSFLQAADVHEPVPAEPAAVAGRVINDLGDTTWIDLLAYEPQATRHGLSESIAFSVAQLEPWRTASMSQMLELWNLHNRQQRAMFNGFRQIENFAEFSSPFFDADLYRFTLGIPQRYRLDEAIYVDMLSRLLPPEVWSIPWQKTGRSPSRRGWVNRLNKTSSLWLSRAKGLVFPHTMRQRSMNPFRVWLRENKRLQHFIVEHLLSWSVMPTPLDQDKVQSLTRQITADRWDMNGRTIMLVFRLLTLSAWPLLYNFGQRGHVHHVEPLADAPAQD